MTALATALFSFSAEADDSQPVCQGEFVDSSVQGRFLNSEEQNVVELSKTHSVDSTGEKTRAWTCEKNGFLVLVLKNSHNTYESNLIATSAKAILIFGLIDGETIDVEGTDKSYPLSVQGLSSLISDGHSIGILKKQ
jgi:hypothetical protein